MRRPVLRRVPLYNVGDEFEFYRDDVRDDFWHMGINTLTKTTGDADAVAGGPKLPFCSEVWDAIRAISILDCRAARL